MKASLLLLTQLLLADGVKQLSSLTPSADTAKLPEKGIMKTWSKSVLMTPGEDGKLHTMIRETRASRLGEGAEAQVSGIIKECKDGECKEREVTKLDELGLPSASRPALFRKKRGSAGLKPPAPFDFAFDLEGFNGLGGFSWLDTSPFLVAPLLHERAPAPKEETSAGDIAGEVKTNAAEVETDTSKASDPAATDSTKAGLKADESTPVPPPAKAEEEGTPKAPARHRRETVMRTVIYTEKDGERKRTEITERCIDGKCTKEVRRLGGSEGSGADLVKEESRAETEGSPAEAEGNSAEAKEAFVDA